MADDDAPLLAALAVMRERGVIGEASLTEAIAHSEHFVALVPPTARTLVDLGSGGGLPGLVIAWRCPRLHITLVERRQTRADLLHRAVAGLGLGDRVAVLTEDVRRLARSGARRFDVVTARSFADPASTLEVVTSLLAVGGTALVSEPPHDRSAVWAAALQSSGELVDDGVHQGIRRILHVPAG